MNRKYISLLLAALVVLFSMGHFWRHDTAKGGAGIHAALRPELQKDSATVSVVVAPHEKVGAAQITVPARATEKRVFIRPSGRLQELVPELKRRALAGDIDAAYFLATELLQCLRNNPVIEELSADGLATLLSKEKRDCSGVDPSDIAAYPKWLQFAADGGSAKAKVEYSFVIDNVMAPEDMIRSPELLLEYKNRSMTYLKGMAGDGDINAIGRLEGIYAAGNLAPKNYFFAYAYHVAVQRFNNAHNDYEQRVLEEYESHLTPVEVQKAKDLGVDISNRATVFN